MAGVDGTVCVVVRVASYVAGLQQPDGSFTGDKWGEVDTRFSYCALNCLALLGKLDAVDVTAATDYVASCRNFDGGFGCTPGAESHAGQVFCCVGALAIGNALHHVDADLLGWWLCERQVRQLWMVQPTACRALVHAGMCVGSAIQVG